MSDSALHRNASESHSNSSVVMPSYAPSGENYTLRIKYGVSLTAAVDHTPFSCPLNITPPAKPFSAKFQRDAEPPSEPLKYATRSAIHAEVGERKRLAALAAKMRERGTLVRGIQVEAKPGGGEDGGGAASQNLAGNHKSLEVSMRLSPVIHICLHSLSLFWHA
jgi:hypothetical protein